jgi:hypothetical protein
MSEGERLAQRLAEDFSLERLKDFLFEKNFTVEESQPPIELKEKLKEHVRSIRQVAYKKLEDINNFNVYAIELKENITERSSKKRQFEIAKEILKAYQLTAGLFVFYPQEGKSFRFSLVFTEPHGTRREYSPYKRYTYFVSPELPNKTFIKQVGGCEFKDLKEIKSAFSVQPLTKEFYREIQTWFYHALENYEKEIFFPGGQKEENLIRLITRLMFVWFIKQMGLVPEKLFDPKELKNIVKDFGNGHNYYNAILQNLFFATLNRPINERGWAKDEGFLKNRNTFGIKSLYRYEDKFLIPPEEVLGLFENIPFINGGLFECLDKDSQYIDGFSRRPDKQAKVPDKYFFQKEEQETDLSKYGLGRAKFRGLIAIFKDYNWTTDESSPIDQEVALDPELLGKVFENLLASYNPETATTARKATGSYYTPKEIVDYMVEESLKEYFKTKTSLSEEKIEDLFYKEEPQLSDEEKKELVRAIADVKIIDPACGSGAFCMGALHKLVELLNKIDPYNELWKEEQQRRLTNELSERWEEMTQEERNEERAYLLEVFNEQRNYPDYGRKLYLIQNCIYGVDIQPIAVQLTKLRFFLSLILDQKPSNDKDNNFGILPLPHLETRFVCANTLIGLESSRRGSVGIIRTQEMMKIERELKRIRERYFRVRNRKQKQELEEKDRELREKLAELLKKQGWDNKDIQKIISFDILDPTAKADWFDPEWMFGVVDGFDIVIGNPPHGANIDDYREYIQRHYKYFETRKNSASLFIENGFEILKQEGILAFVIPKSITFVKSWEKPRTLIYKNNKLLVLIDITKAFENVRLEQVILISQKGKNFNGYEYKAGEYWDDEIKIINTLKTSVADKLGILPIYINEDKLKILEKMLKDSILLGHISETQRGLPFQRKISNNEKGIEIVRGSNIGKYIIYKPLDRVLLTREELNSKRIKKLLRPKIISQNIVAHVMKPFDRIIIMATYDTQGLLTLDTVMNTFLTNSLYPYEYILGILNSRLAEWFYYWFVYNRAVRTMHFDESYLGRLPIKKLNSETQPLADQIVQKVQEILTLTQSPDFETSQEKQQKVKELEREIDQLVYKLYGLTEEEIKIIESN